MKRKTNGVLDTATINAMRLVGGYQGVTKQTVTGRDTQSANAKNDIVVTPTRMGGK